MYSTPLKVNSFMAKSSLWQQLWQQYAVVRQQWGSADVAFQLVGAKAKFYAIWMSYEGSCA
jgi:hypothetical protein